MYLRTHNQQVDVSLSKDCKTNLGIENHFKFLGIEIENNLSYDRHVENVSKWVATGIFLTKCLVNHCSKSILLNVCYRLVHPYAQIWGTKMQHN